MKPQTKDVHVYFPVKVLADIKQLARENRRTTTAEIVIAVERYVEDRAMKPNGKSRGSGGP